MSRRKYTYSMRQRGATQQEIADQFGLNKLKIKNGVNRYKRKQAKLEFGILPRPKG